MLSQAGQGCAGGAARTVFYHPLPFLSLKQRLWCSSWKLERFQYKISLDTEYYQGQTHWSQEVPWRLHLLHKRSVLNCLHDIEIFGRKLVFILTERAPGDQVIRNKACLYGQG